ncbi:MAG: TetR/AcrR family transcriptional regulator [Kofleriaceae bacterium]
MKRPAAGRPRLVRKLARTLVRRRRSPDQAREEILGAAERVFVEFQPDQVGLKDVGREAGVSHALITHYFGTYGGLIESVFERRIRRLREAMLARLREAGALARPNELLAALFAALADPVHLRLTKWMMASERPSAAQAFALRDQGLKQVAQQVAAAVDPSPSRELIGKIESALVVAVSAAYGYAMGREPFSAALGRQPSNELDREVQETLAAMLETHLRIAVGTR